ncbi:hypothetical protein H310_03760 [Aphanomyces invadans]|uniref:Uncharacterized protein n=1 Tax=Aphanomyces invadans TaxID=157072 RepID=A0A024UIB0_9STRA|nr:hypothetical protein H310_03760 [Aphanomyces invadans]ETW06186.1 hypothetical protein H310_03760 [Aphanomyces invadans]|eukprot:XP_008865963.1 hypothetical protein H310_03760 [Aphanomyces invadans]
MFFVHRVKVPGTSSLLQARRGAASVNGLPSISATSTPHVPISPTVIETSTPRTTVPTVADTTSRLSTAPLDKPPSHLSRAASLDVSPYLHDDDVPDDNVSNLPERLSVGGHPYVVSIRHMMDQAFTTTSSWDSSASDAAAGDVEIFRARDSYSAESRLSDLVKLEQILVSPPRVRARTLSWSPQATLAETSNSVASNILRRQRSELSGSEQQLVEVLDDFLDCMKRIYDDRCLKVMPRRRVEADLEGMLDAIETVRRHSDAPTLEAADEMVRMIHHVMEDVHGLHHFGQKGEVEYVKL